MKELDRWRGGWPVTTLVAIWLTMAPNEPVRAHELADDPAVRAFMAEMRDRHGFERAELAAIMAEARVLPAVLEAISRPAEAMPWWRYRALFLTPARIDGGAAFWAEHRAELERARSRFGVAPEVIVAIIGIETAYGRYTGRYRVLDALATLAFRYPRRADFFRRELREFLLLTREEDLDPLAITGSYAGAMGVPQFISSSYRHYAIDFDGDRVRDLLASRADAIGSVAHYLSEHGWRPRGEVAVPAQVDGQRYRELLDAGIKPHTELAAMREQGVSVAASVPDGEKGALIELELEGGAREHWVGLWNFYAITRYNPSALYAMAVHQLASAIRDQVRS